MTSSRFQTVRNAIEDAFYDSGGWLPDGLVDKMTQAAIEANDAWLTTQGFMLLSPGWSNHWISPNAELPKGNVCNPPTVEDLEDAPQ